MAFGRGDHVLVIGICLEMSFALADGQNCRTDSGHDMPLAPGSSPELPIHEDGCFGVGDIDPGSDQWYIG